MVFNNKMIYLFFNVRSERWECIVGMTVRGSCHLVLTAAFHKQPMQHTHTQWCYVVSLTFLQNKPCCTAVMRKEVMKAATGPTLRSESGVVVVVVDCF